LTLASHDSSFGLKTYTKEQDDHKKKWAGERLFVNHQHGKEGEKRFDSVGRAEYVDTNRVS
jgi:hypothetical protein